MPSGSREKSKGNSEHPRQRKEQERRKAVVGEKTEKGHLGEKVQVGQSESHTGAGLRAGNGLLKAAPELL